MGKNLTPKVILIIVLLAVAALALYPPGKTLKPGIDLAGGTSLIYEIDTHGLKEEEQVDLAQRMITVLRRRIDPANIQNLIWRPQGNTRFEIQMPLASKEARTKRDHFDTALSNLISKNVNRTKIVRSLTKPIEERTKYFNDLAQDDPNRLTILNTLSKAYDERKELQSKRDKFSSELKTTGEKIKSAGLNLDLIEQNRSNWAKLNQQQLQESLKKILDDVNDLALPTKYIGIYTQWSEAVNKLMEQNSQFDEAKRQLDKLNMTEEQVNFILEMSSKSDKRRQLDKLNMTEEQVNFILEMSPKSDKRRQQIEQLKTEFPDRAEKIDHVVTAYDEYSPFKGRLDDPKDLQRMLKGAGILEFRILPTLGQLDLADLTPDEVEAYGMSITEKGPKYASDNRYIWLEIENFEEWKNPNTIVAPFGNKYYVLASNKANETMLHSPNKSEWKLEKANPTTDDMGRRAIGFLLDERGGKLFYNITKDNPNRPLCILLDNIAISAPNIDPKGGPIGKRGVITGDFTQTDVADMVNKLNAGSLPARLIEQPISIKTIGPSIGVENRDKGIKAGLIGLTLVILCMLIYYMLAGSIADVALLMNVLFVLAIMAGIRATFTLPGIAGIILTIGMSVDANVLIFERIREEQQKGASLGTAIRNGYQRALRAILDANITTFITAAILYWRASEEIRGFALVLMLGIASSMFTALFVTRLIFDFLLKKRIIKNHLFMLRLIHQPNINWMGARPIFFCISAVLIIAGLVVFFMRDDTKNNKYDIEFTGGTSVQINLKESRSRQYVKDKILRIGQELNNPALAAANVYSTGKSDKEYEINTTETNKTTATVNLPESEQSIQYTDETIKSKIEKAQTKLRGKLSNLSIKQVNNNTPSFEISTSQVSPSLVEEVLRTAFPNADISRPQIDEVVNNAIKTAFINELEIQQNLRPEITSTEKVSGQLIDSYPELVDFMGGIKIECKIERASTLQDIEARMAALQFKPDMQNLNRYLYKILSTNLTPIEPNQPINSFAYLSVQEEAGLRELTEEEWSRFVENETTKVLAATKLEASLPRVTQIDPSVGAEQKTRALIAIVLSLFAIVAYIWFRFGNLRYGLAAISALVHDVCITLGTVTACTYIAATPIGEKLLIGDFKINLAIIAAFLTLIGYSLNDTIVVFDRIRENRHKGRLNSQIINNSINQTISRTILTSFTTFIVVLIMYIFGGAGLRGFTFAIGFGIIVGTYSSIAIAAPVLLLGTKTKTDKGK